MRRLSFRWKTTKICGNKTKWCHFFIWSGIWLSAIDGRQYNINMYGLVNQAHLLFLTLVFLHLFSLSRSWMAVRYSKPISSCAGANCLQSPGPARDLPHHRLIITSLLSLTVNTSFDWTIVPKSRKYKWSLIIFWRRAMDVFGSFVRIYLALISRLNVEDDDVVINCSHKETDSSNAATDKPPSDRSSSGYNTAFIRTVTGLHSLRWSFIQVVHSQVDTHTNMLAFM